MTVIVLFRIMTIKGSILKPEAVKAYTAHFIALVTQYYLITLITLENSNKSINHKLITPNKKSQL